MALPHLCADQEEFIAGIDAARAQGHRCIFGIAPCGFGKTVVAAYLILRESGHVLAQAHRRELIGQMSIALARNGVRHRIFGPRSLIQKVVRRHIRELGRSFYDPLSRVAVASTDSIKTEEVDIIAFLSKVAFVLTDEGHHALADNKWGRVLALCHNAWMFMPTATCFRADGKGLGRHADGFGDAMVFGPTYREAIDNGRLLDYRIVLSDPPDYERPTDADVGENGEIKQKAASASVHKSKTIVGNITDAYLEHARGKLGLTFCVDIEAAIEQAADYNLKGVRAEVVTGKTDPDIRDAIFARFERREVMQIVNVGIAGEGTDIPGVEVVSMGAPTASRGWFDQMFGRGSRLAVGAEHMARWWSYTAAERKAVIAASPKPNYLVIDHCNNVRTHLPPDAWRPHTLDRRDRKSRAASEGVIPQRMCTACYKPYERILRSCPFCGKEAPPPAGRSSPEQVDGNLYELDEAALKALRGEVARVDGPARLPANASGVVVASVHKAHLERQHAQAALRAAIQLWAGAERDLGREMPEQYMRFYFTFGLDVMSAQALGRPDAEALLGRVQADLDRRGVVPTET